MNNFNFYTKETIKHFKNPRNYGRIANPDGIGKVGNIVCGDIMALYIKVGKGEVIKDIKFETFGCVAAISTSSVITGLAKGKTLEQAMKMGKKEIVQALGSLPTIKLHCSLLAADALAEAIYDYLLKNKKDIPFVLKEKHKRIEKERKIVEKRHNDLLK